MSSNNTIAHRSLLTVPGKTTYSSKHFTFKLRTAIIFAILVSTFLAALVMHFGWRFFVTQELNKFTGVLNREIIRSTRRELNSIFAQAIELQENIHHVFQEGILDPNNPQDIQGLYMAAIAPTEHTWLAYGKPNGDFFGARQLATDTIQWVESTWSENTESAFRDITEFTRTPQGYLITDRSFLTNNYYSPRRTWFRLASATSANIWTPVYIFSTSGRPGINSAIGMYDDLGEIEGVITVAIELDQISDFLASLEVSENGAILIVNNNRQIVAFPDKSEVVITSEESLSVEQRFNPECQCWEFVNQPQSETTLRDIAQGNDRRLQVVHQVIQGETINLDTLDAAQETLFTYEDEEYLVVFDQVAQAEVDADIINMSSSRSLDNLGWFIGAVIPSEDIIGGIQRESFLLLAITYSAIVILILIILFLSNRLIVRPINLLAKQADHIRQFKLDLVELPGSSVREINRLIGSIDRMNSGLSSFGRYVPTELVQQLITQGIEARLGGEVHEISIFFCDLAGFTSATERMGEKIVDHLDKYFTHLSQIINDCGGTIDKYIGDAIMAFWGAPLSHPDHAVSACRAALLCERTLDRLRTEWRSKGQEELYARYGVNTGHVLVGNFGSAVRMSYTAIGDPVNVTARLEALNKVYGTQILIGEGTCHKIRDRFITRHIDRVAVYGRAGVMEIYELVGVKDNDYYPDDYTWIKHFEEGLLLYRQREWSDAAKCFHDALQLRDKEDTPSLLFIQRCTHLAKQKVPENWDATFVLKNK